MEKVINWAKKLKKQKKFWGEIFDLGYKIGVNAYFQSAVHLIASCLLGAFAYKDSTVNWIFLIPFGIIYLLLIVIFCFCNQHRKNRNNILRQYEYSYSQIEQSLLEEYRKNLDLYNPNNNLALDDLLENYQNVDFFTESCFRVCNCINNILEETTDIKYRVTIYLRTNIDRDEYRINSYSPLSSEPEAYNQTFILEDFRNKPLKQIPAHARPFLNTRCEPLICIGAQKVKKVYKNFNVNNPTKLHIGIPISINGMVTLVLQITSHDEYNGKENNVRDLIDNVLNIFIAYLKIVYMHQIEHEQLVNSSSIKEECTK